VEIVNLASIVQIVFVMAGVIIALVQLRSATKARIGQSLHPMLQEFNVPQRLLDRRMIFECTEAELLAPGPELRNAMQRVTEFHQWSGLLVDKGLLPEDAMFIMYSQLFAASWQRLLPFIQHVRQNSGAANYADYFQKFAEKCIAYRLHRYGGVGSSVAEAISGYGQAAVSNEVSTRRRAKKRPPATSVGR
jgi:hypothetical protein